MESITHIEIRILSWGQTLERLPDIRKSYALFWVGRCHSCLDCSCPRALTPETEGPGSSPQITDTPVSLRASEGKQKQKDEVSNIPSPPNPQPACGWGCTLFMRSCEESIKGHFALGGQDLISSRHLRISIPSVSCTPTTESSSLLPAGSSCRHPARSSVTWFTTDTQPTFPSRAPSTQPHQLRLWEMSPAALYCTSSPPLHSSLVHVIGSH